MASLFLISNPSFCSKSPLPTKHIYSKLKSKNKSPCQPRHVVGVATSYTEKHKQPGAKINTISSQKQ